MTRRVLALALLALAAPLVALAATRGGGATPSFTRDVAPIIQQKCAGCHQVGGIAPFPLETAGQARSKASLIAAAVQARVMPPWPPGNRSPAYVGEAERKLTATERATILAWARAGGRVDGPARKPLPPKGVPVAPGESVLRMRLPAAYTPRAPKGATDDYRCFLLDPKLAADSAATSARIDPGQPKVVHHVILFRVSKAQVAEARQLDAKSSGLGWTCFGGTGLSLSGSTSGIQDALNNADWIAAWAPGFGGARVPDGTGVPLPAGSQVVMQVHYNLLNGRAPDRSGAVLTVDSAPANLKPLQTMLLPGPVELACASGERSRLCNRNEALAELSRKYGAEAAFVPAGLLILCRGTPAPRASAVSTCDRRISQPTTIHVAAGHMHLLGASIRLELNPGTPRARILLDIPRWDFHWQNAYTLERAVEAAPGDVVRVTCRHDVHKRMHGGHGIPPAPRYVLWGEGTTDEMCLGILQVTRR
jgi:Copper type II ascorbate-dependent monooxygenase, N-terminal domain/Copper type II ascorbate-dependent monooxygenase, C-terminal domain